MSPEPTLTYSERVIVVAPTGRDEEVTCRLFESAGIECIAGKDAADLVAAADEGVGALVLTDISMADQRSISLLGAEKSPSPRYEALAAGLSISSITRPTWRRSGTSNSRQAQLRARKAVLGSRVSIMSARR